MKREFAAVTGWRRDKTGVTSRYVLWLLRGRISLNPRRVSAKLGSKRNEAVIYFVY
jgi:hypothetical protein